MNVFSEYHYVEKASEKLKTVSSLTLLAFENEPNYVRNGISSKKQFLRFCTLISEFSNKNAMNMKN